MLPPGTHFATDSTETMQIKCHARGHNILREPKTVLIETNIPNYNNNSYNFLSNKANTVNCNNNHIINNICYSNNNNDDDYNKYDHSNTIIILL